MATVIGNRKVRTAQEIRNNQSLKFDIEIQDIMGEQDFDTSKAYESSCKFKMGRYEATV
jgi:hypothetical protein